MISNLSYSKKPKKSRRLYEIMQNKFDQRQQKEKYELERKLLNMKNKKQRVNELQLD